MFVRGGRCTPRIRPGGAEGRTRSSPPERRLYHASAARFHLPAAMDTSRRLGASPPAAHVVTESAESSTLAQLKRRGLSEWARWRRTFCHHRHESVQCTHWPDPEPRRLNRAPSQADLALLRQVTPAGASLGETASAVPTAGWKYLARYK